MVRITADRQEKEGSRYHLQGSVEIAFRDMRLTADEADYDEGTQVAVVRGHVRLERSVQNEDIHAERAEYNLETEKGVFYQVHGTSGARLGGHILLTTTNPFFFEARRVDKVGEDTYVLYHGYVTSCRTPNPLWTFHAGSATIRPGESAFLHNTWLRFKKVPFFYSPFFYHSLKRIPRSSGFLTPHIGTSSRKGKIAGESFFWAINRSADALLGAEYYSKRGWAQHATLRLRPAGNSYLTATYFGVLDRGLVRGNQRQDQGGRALTVTGASELPRGFRAVANVNYLSSFLFRLGFTESYNDAIGTEVHSTAFLTKHFDSYGFHAAFSRYQNFQGTAPRDSIEIRALPSVQFSSVDRKLLAQAPLWFSFDTAVEGMSRSEPHLETSKFVDRFDVFPRLSVPLHWKHVHLAPTFGFRATHYGSSLAPQGSSGQAPGTQPLVSGRDLTRVTEEFGVDLRPPALARIFRSPWAWLGDRWKHVIEPRASFHYVNGVRDFQQTLRFDERDVLANTRELEYSVANRIYSKNDKDGQVKELLSWELTQRYFFDPTFGGALVPGRRNVFTSSLGLTGYAFLDRPRRFSPINSMFHVKPSHRFDTDLSLDYDPDRHRVVNTGLAANLRLGKEFFTSLSHYLVRSDPILAAPSNQLRGTVGYGHLNRLGPNIAYMFVYDVRNGLLQYSATQASYNVDCCGLAVEWRRFNFGGTRSENQWRLVVSFANVGTFGNLKKQERLF